MRHYFRLLLGGVLILAGGCCLPGLRMERVRPPRGVAARSYVLETTGYCPCGLCCGWRRNWLGRPVIVSGPDRGRTKKVGVTASGTRARHGTLAADTDIFPFGTVIYIPGYGYGRVEDRGSDVKGYHIDLFFRRHNDAVGWGRVRKRVKVWPPAPR